MVKRTYLRFMLVLGLAMTTLAAILGLLTASSQSVYAASQPAKPLLDVSSSPAEHFEMSPEATVNTAYVQQSGAPSVITVCNSCPYTSIQAAIYDVAPEGTVQVAAGTYTDSDGDGWVAQITKSLTLQGGYTASDWTAQPDPDANLTVLDGENGAGGIRISEGAAPLIAGFELVNGQASKGGGVFVVDGAPVLRDNELHDNVAESLNGGAIYIASGEPTIERNRIYNNTAFQSGGGVYILSGAPEIHNNLIYSNTATLKRGGGIYVWAGSTSVLHNVLYANQAQEKGGGLFILSGSSVVRANVVVSNTSLDGGGIYGSAGSAVLDYNNVWQNTGDNYAGGVSTGTHSISADPMFENVSLPDFYLQGSSPCINQVPVTASLSLDYAGRARPFDGQSDIGAHEFYTGTCFARAGGGRVYSSVQEAVDVAGENEVVQVAGHCAGVTSRAGLSQTVYISKALTLVGGYSVTSWINSRPIGNPSILDAQGHGRVIYIDSVERVSVAGLHIFYGDAEVGAGIYALNGPHIIRDNEIYSNTAAEKGGGIYMGSAGQIYRNSIHDNIASGDLIDRVGGGGICVEGAGTQMYENVIYNNETDQGMGGGVCVKARANLQDNIVRDNQSAYDGGGLYVRTSNVIVQYNTIYNNTCNRNGGGVYVWDTVGASSLGYNAIYSNTAHGAGTANYGGGGIYSEGSNNSKTGPTIQHNVISSNTVSCSSPSCGGGGISIQGYTAVDENLIGNNRSRYGIAIFNAGAGGSVEVTQNKIFQNGDGGIYANNYAWTDIENNLIYGNIGTGIELGDGGIAQNNTIYNNQGDGYYRFSGLSNNTTIIRNSIVVSNTGCGVRSDTDPSKKPLYINHVDVWQNGTGNYCEEQVGNIQSSNTITENPLFVNPDTDLHLQAGSPCRDTADPNNYPVSDHDGYARPFGLRADMGAYEYYAGNCLAQIEGATQVYTTVQAAVDVAADGAVVKVAGYCVGVEPHAGLTQTVYISKPLTLRGGYTFTNWFSPTSISTLDALGEGRAIYITGTNNVVIESLVVSSGTAPVGGGIYVADDVDVVVQNVIFADNSAARGGGFAAVGGTPHLYNNTLAANTASLAGGGLYFSGGAPVISNTLIVSNTGGAISTSVPITLYYSDVWGNSGCDWCSNTAVGPGSFSQDPNFRDFPARDLHLTLASPGVHAGDPNTAVSTDIEGQVRPLGQASDIGADESDQYPDVTLESPSLIGGIPGEQVTHLHYLTNEGTDSDIFSLASTLKTTGPGTNWDVDYVSQYHLDAGETTAVPVTIRVPEDAISGTSAILVLTATSQINNFVQDRLIDNVVVNWNPGLNIVPEYDEKLSPGTVMTYAHILINTGNASDTVDINWNSTLPWATVTPTQDIKVGANMTTTFFVILDIPATAPGGITLTTELFASGISGAQAAVTDTTIINHTTGDRYVATGGDDALNNCLIDTYPCASVAYAVNQATTNDTVKVSQGTYLEQGVVINKDITVRGGYDFGWSTFAPDVYPTIIDAQARGRVMEVLGRPTVEGFTLTGGATDGSGAGVYIDVGSPTLRRNTIVGNVAELYGGGVYVALGTPLVEQNVISGNVARLQGGGVYNGSGSSVIHRNTIAFNESRRGAGFTNNTGNPGFWNNVLYANIASAQGGAMYVAGGTPQLWHNMLYQNQADQGGGAYLAGGAPTLKNTIIISNTANQGGGVYSQTVNAVLSHNNVWRNVPDDYVGTSAGPDDLSENPLLVDLSQYNMHIQSDSPCRNVGATAPTAIQGDIDGQPRTMGPAPDMGVDEYQDSGLIFEADEERLAYPDSDTDYIAVYAHTLTNTGNYTDTFLLTWHNQHGWTVRVEGKTTAPAAVTVGPNTSELIVAQVRVPAGTVSGTVDTTIITATSELNPQVFDTVVETTTVATVDGVLLEPDHTGTVDSAESKSFVYTHTLTNLGNQTNTFTLEATSNQGLDPELPSSFVLGPGEQITFSVFTDISGVSPSTVLIDETVITATSAITTAVFDTATNLTYINLRPGVELESDETGDGTPGQWITYTHTLTNAGNYTDTFSFSTISSEGWTVEPPEAQELGAGQVVTVNVRALVPFDALSGTVDVISVTATSQFSVAVQASVTDTTWVGPYADVVADPAMNIVGWCVYTTPNTILYSFAVTNTGNFTDTFDFDAESSEGYLVSLIAPAWRELAPQETLGEVLVYVEVPTVTTQLTDTLTFTATSRSDGAVYDTASYVTRINWDVGVDMAPNRSGTVITETSIFYSHTVTNTGADPNTVELTWGNDLGWQVIVDGTGQQPVRIDLDPGEARVFNAEVRVPYGTISATGHTAITGTMTYYCNAQDFVVDTTTVRRPDVTLEPDYTRSVQPRSIVTFTHVLTNSGAVTDSYTISYTVTPGWLATVTPTLVYTVPPGGTAPVVAAVTVPDKLSGSEGELVLYATSLLYDVEDTAVDQMSVAYAPGATVAPNNFGHAAPTDVVTYAHALTNTGNYTQAFDLTTHSSFGYAEVSPEYIPPLGPGEAYTDIQVTVWIPSHAAADEVEQTQVIASFAGEQAVAVNATTIDRIYGTRYVALGGTDTTNNCTVLDYGPCASPQHAVDQAYPGDEIRVAGGTYTGTRVVEGTQQVVRIDKSVLIRGGYAIDEWETADPVARPTILDADQQGRVVYITADITPTLEGFHLREGKVSSPGHNGAGVYIVEGAEPVLGNNWIYNNTTEGFDGDGGGVYYGGAGSPLFAQNTLYNNTTDDDGGGMYLGLGSTAQLRNNVIYQNSAGALGGGVYAGGNVTLWNNTFYQNHANLDGGGIYVAAQTATIRNSIFANNAQYGVAGLSDSTLSLDYNDVWHNTPANYQNVLSGSHDISLDPAFVAPSSGDLHLTGSSPCIDAGDPSTTLVEDREGNPRPLLSGYDIGAYEYGMTSRKSVTPALASPSSFITYTIEITNTGDIFRSAAVTDTLHPYLSFGALVYLSDGSLEYNPATHVVRWVGDVGPDSSAYITFTARITDWVAANTAITNVALVDQNPTNEVTTWVDALSGTRYVAQSGASTDTDNNCTEPWRPCRTVQYAVDQALAGDDVLVATGVYTAPPTAMQVVSVTESIRLMGGYTHTTWSYQPDTYATALDAQVGRPGVVVSNGAEVTVAGLRITNGTDGVAISSASAWVTRTEIYANSANGVALDGGAVDVQRSRIHSNGGNGVYVASGSYALTNNLLAHNSGLGLQVASGTGAVMHNTIARNGGGGARVSGSAQFTNTIFYSHTVSVDATGGSAALWNTLWWPADTTVSGNVISETSVFGDPRFANPTAIDYHIQAGSYALDMGFDLGVDEDIDGGVRPLLAAPDIGADEFPLAVTKTAPPTAEPGALITYVVRLSGEATGLALTDTLPLYVRHGGTIDCNVGSCSYDASARRILWDGDILSGQPAYVTYTAWITDWLASGVQVVNTADVEMDGDLLETAPVATTIEAVSGDRYVAADGSSTDVDNNCLRTWKPCRTVQYGVDQALNGDAVLVAAGDYGSVDVAKSVHLIGGHSPVDWTYDPVAHVTTLEPATARPGLVITDTATVVVAGLDVVGGSDGVLVDGATAVISRTRIYSNTGDGFQAEDSAFALVNTLLAHNTGAGLRTAASDGVVSHATVARNGAAGAVVGGTAHFTNTILYDHTVGVSVTVGSATMQNTLWWQNDTPTLGSVTRTGDVSGDPAFLNPAGLDYHLRGDSPAVDAGLWAGVRDDLDGDRRPQDRVDIGADQYPLRIEREVITPQVASCAWVTHVLSLTNLSGAPLADVSLTETLPVEVSYVVDTFDSSTGFGQVTGDEVTWGGAVTDTVTLSFTVQVEPYLNSGTVIAHQATVEDPISTFDEPKYELTVDAQDVDLHQAAPAAMAVGETVTYTLAYTVPGGHVAYAPTLVARLPRLVTASGISTTAALTYVPGTAQPATVSVASAGDVLTWTLDTVTAPCGTPRVLTATFAAQVRNLPDNGAGDPLTTTATLSYNETSSEGPAQRIESAHVATLVEPSLQLVKRMSPSANVGSLDLVTTIITLTNSGTSPVYDVWLTDTLPGELHFESLVGAASYGEQAGVITWTVGQVNVGRVVFTITARAVEDLAAGVDLVNDVSARGSSQPMTEEGTRTYQASNQDTATAGYPNLVIDTLLNEHTVPFPGEEIAYNVQYTNTGVVRAMDVTIVDTLPVSISGVTYRSSRPANAVQVGSVITWTLTEPLNRSLSGMIWITGTLSAEVTDGTVLSNTAYISTTTEEESIADNGTSTTSIVQPNKIFLPLVLRGF